MKNYRDTSMSFTIPIHREYLYIEENRSEIGERQGKEELSIKKVFFSSSITDDGTFLSNFYL